MNNMKKTLIIGLAALAMVACTNQPATKQVESPMDTILLNDYRPVNVNNIPETFVEKAKFPVIDLHSHDYATSPEEVAEWVKTMDACGITETHVMHCAWIGDPVETILERYADYPDRFKVWCCFDYTKMLEDGSADEAIAYLEKCHNLGVVVVGEMGDKGEGDLYARPTEGRGIHLDDPRLQPVLAKCGELHMPISIHIAEPYWMYLPQNRYNDGLPNGAVWHVDTTAVGCLGYNGLMASFENAVRENPISIPISTWTSLPVWLRLRRPRVPPASSLSNTRTVLSSVRITEWGRICTTISSVSMRPPMSISISTISTTIGLSPASICPTRYWKRSTTRTPPVS